MTQWMSEWVSAPWLQACKRQGILHRRPHPCPGVKEAFRLYVAKEAKEAQRGWVLSTDTLQRWRPVGRRSVCLQALSTAPNHSSSSSTWKPLSSPGLRGSKEEQPGEGIWGSYPQESDLLPPWKWGSGGGESIVQTKEYYTARKRKDLLWKGAKWRTVFIICAEKKEGKLYIIFAQVCGKLFPVEILVPSRRKIMWPRADGRDLLFIDSPFVPLEILNPRNALPIQKITWSF